MVKILYVMESMNWKNILTQTILFLFMMQFVQWFQQILFLTV